MTIQELEQVNFLYAWGESAQTRVKAEKRLRILSAIEDCEDCLGELESTDWTVIRTNGTLFKVEGGSKTITVGDYRSERERLIGLLTVDLAPLELMFNIANEEEVFITIDSMASVDIEEEEPDEDQYVPTPPPVVEAFRRFV